MHGVEGRAGQAFNKSVAMKHEESYHIVFIDSVSQIGQATWDGLCTSRQYCRYNYMMALEASRLDCQFIYAVARNACGVLGIALATLWRISLPGRIGLRVLSTGTPLNTGSPLMVATGADNVQVSRELMTAMEGRARALGVRLFVGRDLPAANFCNLPRLERLYACAYLDLWWRDFEQYLASRSKSQSIRRDMRAVEKAGYKLEIRRGQPLTAMEVTRLQELRLPLYHKHRSPDQFLILETFFHQVSKLEHAIWLLLSQDGEIHAFDLCFALGHTLESICCGIDLVATGRLAVHRVMNYEIVRYAIEQQFKTINFGLSHEQSMLEAGCQLRAHYAWIEAYPKWLGALLRPMILKAILHDENADKSAAGTA